MRDMLVIVAMLFLLVGCAGRQWAPLRGQTQEQFTWDVRECGSSTTPRGYAVPMIVAPLVMGLEIARAHATRRCLEARGWRVVGEPQTAAEPQPPL